MSHYGIIGTGNIGSAIARALTNAGESVVLANRRGPSSLAPLVQSLGPHAKAGSVEEAAAADVVFVAVNWSKIPDALRSVGSWEGRIVVDANNPIEAPEFRPFDLGDRSSTEIFSSYAPGARVVKAFNHLQPHLLWGDPKAEGGRRVMFVASNDVGARKTVAQLISRLGFFPVDLGNLNDGGRMTQFPGGALTTLNLVRFD